jgi:PTH1 family peptidyl-tRNA hydrolase
VKLIVGLGNPGPTYRGTRHNVGFAVVDELAERAGAAFETSPVDALMVKWRSMDALLAKPLTFMNRSGDAVAPLMRYFKVAPGDVLVILDEVQLPLGRLRARARGSAGGHNGLKSIVEHLGQEVARLRLGVGRGDDRRDLSDHVLARFDREEMVEADRMIARAVEAAEVFIASGIEAVMNRFNGGDPATTE